MKFAFCGNLDCPEWALAEVSLLNRMSAIKLKLLLAQIVKKVSGQPWDQEKLVKLCRDQKFDLDETKVCLSLVEFLVAQAAKHQVSDKVLSKDLLQMGVAIENANAIVKAVVENVESMARTLRDNTLRVSQLEGVNYAVGYILGSSRGGCEQVAGQGMQPLDMTVTLNLDIVEFPKKEVQSTPKITHANFGMTRDKFLQFSRDMKQALSLLEASQQQIKQL